MTAEEQMGAAFLAMLAFIILALAGWITHVIVCIKTGNYVFLVAGAICAPIGTIHGWGVWIGAW